MSQLQARYGSRNWRIPLSIPSGAKAFLLKFPPMSGDAYADQHFGPPYVNADRPTGGTYRLGSGAALSFDMVTSAAFPLTVTWQDADQASGSIFLPHLVSPYELEAPEYVLPAGMAYSPCYTQGNCPPAVLDEIYQKVMSLEITYLHVQGPPIEVQWTSLRMAGPSWRLDAQNATSTDIAAGLSEATITNKGDTPPALHVQFLPLVMRDPWIPCPERPCGAFDWQGRLVDIVP
jgi:hypothetical protein